MRPRLITFDCYGTLIDWRAGIRAAVHRHVPRASGLDEEELFSAFAEIENEVEAGEYRPYREVLRRTALGLARRFVWPLGEEAGFLAESLPGWTPFPDTNPALERLRGEGYRLGIVSNVDDDLLAATCRHFTVPFDVLITAEQVESYKPAPAHFRRALEHAGGEPARLLHVARSWYHDVQPAEPLGIPVVWVNRNAERRPAGPAPAAEVPDLRRMVEWLEGPSGAA